MDNPSPISGKRTEYLLPLGSDRWYFVYKHDGEPFADLRVTERSLQKIWSRQYPKGRRIFGDRVEDFYTPEEYSAAIDLIRSYLWRERARGTAALVVCDQEFFDLSSASIGEEKMRGHILKTFDSFVSEAKTLTFTEKAMQTLSNMQTLWRRLPSPYTERFMAKQGDGSLTYRYLPDVEVSGIAYGCSTEEAPLMFEFLNDEGFLIARGDGLRVSGKGLQELDRFERGANHNVRRAFVVRAWSGELDKVLQPILGRVAQNLNCTIKPIWEEDFNDKIDERIFRLIRESSVIVADISHNSDVKPDRFNVGLEIGYAYALGKPIVLIRRRPPQDEATPKWVKDYPFDISTMNCFDYAVTPEGLAELENKITARVGLALDELALR